MNACLPSLLFTAVSTIPPGDDLEGQQIEETGKWINSGAPLFRLQKPAIPPKHLCVYFVLVDEKARKVLLVDHIQAQLWLPPGGHVEPDEHPLETVKRECREELHIAAEFLYPSPFFLTSTTTQGLQPGHIDVSLWYILKGNAQHNYAYDTQEFQTIHWFGLDEIPYDKTDPHMKRFIQKLTCFLGPESPIKK